MICEIRSSWILSHAKFIEKTSRDLRRHILDQDRIAKMFIWRVVSAFAPFSAAKSECAPLVVILAEIRMFFKFLLIKRLNRHAKMPPSPSQCKSLWTCAFLRSKVRPTSRDAVSSLYALVFLSGLWERMTNDTEGSTSRSLERQERYDLSLWLTCAISLNTYSNSSLNPSLFWGHFPHRSAFACSQVWSILQDKDLLVIQRSHLDGTLEVRKQDKYKSQMRMCFDEDGQREVLKTPKIHNKYVWWKFAPWHEREQNRQVFDSCTAGQGFVLHLELSLSGGFHSRSPAFSCSAAWNRSQPLPFQVCSVDIQESGTFRDDKCSFLIHVHQSDHSNTIITIITSRCSKPPISLQVMLAYKSTLYNITMTLKSCSCYYYCLNERRQLKVVDRRVEVLCGMFFSSSLLLFRKPENTR